MWRHFGDLSPKTIDFQYDLPLNKVPLKDKVRGSIPRRPKVERLKLV